MKGQKNCTLRTAVFLAALLIPGGCLALLAVTLLRGAVRAHGQRAAAAPVAEAAP